MSNMRNDGDEKFREVRVGDEPKVLVPEGQYSVVYSKDEITNMHGRPKLIVKFTISDFGEYLGKELPKFYNYYDPLPRGSDLYKDLVHLYGRTVRKNAKLSFELFKKRVLKVRVRTVVKDRKQIETPEHQKYSVIDSILSVETSQNLGRSV